MGNPFAEARAGATPEARAAIDLSERFFAALEAMDFAKLGAMMSSDGLYRDEPTHAADARGPAAVEAKLRNALTGLDRFAVGMKRVVGAPNRVMSERIEEWHFPTGEVAKLPVMCVQEVQGGKIALWHEYWNLPSLMEAMPASWMQEIAKRSSGG